MSGFVTFVSAGPGDPELLTLKAAARLGAADVVLYDDLAAGAVLDHVRKGANLVSVGKRAGKRSAKQEHVSRLLVDYAATGASVVRLKSGDAGIFGRLEEELEALRSAGIAYEIRNETIPYPGAVFSPEIWVIEDSELARACELRDAVSKLPEEAQSSWTCSSCGEQLEGQFGACWKCGATRNADS